jgi:nucleoside-diphosphate-sugar epimerase
VRRSILVTGGFGFLGSHLVERLASDGDADVHVVDDLTTSRFSARDACTFRDDCHRRWPSSAVTFDLVSVQVYGARPAPPAERRFEEVYHLASVVGPVGVLGHAGTIVASVVGDTYAAMDLAWAHHGGTLCDVSTSEVYGGGRAGACAESDARVVPAETTVRLEYAVAKMAAETALVNAARALGRRGVVVRPFNVAGPGQSAAGGFVLPRFVGQALAGEPLTVYGDGSAVRAFTHVVDVADGLVRAARAGTSGCAYNLGRAANRTTILDLARLVIEATGSASPIVHVDPRGLHGPAFAEAGDKYPDGDLATRALGWVPERGLAQIVHDVVADARARGVR